MPSNAELCMKIKVKVDDLVLMAALLTLQNCSRATVAG